MPLIESLTSPANALLKDIRKAQERGTVTSDGWCIVEGPRMVREALKDAAHRVRCIVATTGTIDALNCPANARLIEVPDALFRDLAGTETPQGVLALIEPVAYEAGDLVGPDALVVVLDGLLDPGNAGTIARAAEAFGATGLVFRKGTVGALHPKTLRASAGSLLRLPFVTGVEGEKVIESIQLIAAVPAACDAESLHGIDLTKACALVIGSEGHGVSPDILARARRVSIPTSGVESLNAAMAATVLLYEAARQRGGAAR